jgi:replicative DNA helicase
VAKEIDKLPPHDDLMERAVLGAIMGGHQQASELLDIVKPEDFFNLRNQAIARVTLDLHAAGNCFDFTAVHDEIARSGESENMVSRCGETFSTSFADCGEWPLYAKPSTLRKV